MTIEPVSRLNGTINLSGDKSISHRAAMLLGFSEGEAEISNYSNGDDCASTLECLRALGVGVEKQGNRVFVRGVGSKGLEKPSVDLDCGNSGTTIRLLTGLLSGMSTECRLIGDDSLSKRPMSRIVDPLNSLGASIKTSDGYAPIRIEDGTSIEGGSYELPVPSAQIKSALMFAALSSKQTVEVIGTVGPKNMSASRDHSERMLKYLGFEFDETYYPEGNGARQTLSIPSGGSLVARDLDMPGDVSSAAFFLVAAAGLPGSKIEIKNVGLNPTRIGILRILKSCGLNFSVNNSRIVSNEPRGDIRFESPRKLKAIDRIVLRGVETASVIDEIPILAVLGTVLPNGIEIRDAAELRVKESDRIDSVVRNLVEMGAACEEYEDGFRVDPGPLNGGDVDSFDDHRIAMSFAVAGLFARSETRIKDADCASVSFPEFFELIERLSV